MAPLFRTMIADYRPSSSKRRRAGYSRDMSDKTSGPPSFRPDKESLKTAVSTGVRGQDDDALAIDKSPGETMLNNAYAMNSIRVRSDVEWVASIPGKTTSRPD